MHTPFLDNNYCVLKWDTNILLDPFVRVLHRVEIKTYKKHEIGITVNVASEKQELDFDMSVMHAMFFFFCFSTLNVTHTIPQLFSNYLARFIMSQSGAEFVFVAVRQPAISGISP